MYGASPSGGGVAATLSSSSLGTSSGTKRRLKPDSDNEMLRELVKTLCECLFRSRSPKLQNANTPQEKPRKTKWFGIVSDKVPEVDRLMNEWNPHSTTIISVYCDTVLLECWSVRYKLSVGTDPARGRMYARLMVLVRSLICVAQALPTSRSSRPRNDVQIRFCDTDGEPYDVVPPLAEQFCFPSVDMTFGSVDVEVRYRTEDLAAFTEDHKETTRGTNVIAGETRTTTTNNILSQSIVEDYIGGGRRPSSSSLGADSELNNAVTEEDDAENRRWRRWASESFDERERELNSTATAREGEEEEDQDISAPPDNRRVSSNPMAIPQGKSYGGPEAPKRGYEESASEAKSYQTSASLRSRQRKTSSGELATSAPPASGSSIGKLVRKSSGLSGGRGRGSDIGDSRVLARHSSSVGYSVADLVGANSTVGGTPILSSLPFAVGSLTSSATSETAGTLATTPKEASSLRTRFLAGIDMSASSSSPPFPVPFMSAGSLMISRHSSALALLDHPAMSPSPTPSAVPPAATSSIPQQRLPTISHAAMLAQQAFYEAALPWVLTPSEMERPFSSMGNSVTLGARVDESSGLTSDGTNGSGKIVDQHRHAIKQKKSANELEIEDEDELALPFVADDDDDNDLASQHEANEEVSLVTEADNKDLGAFVRRCREDRKLFSGPNESTKVEDVKKQLDLLMHQSGLDRATQGPHEVVTVYEERAL